MAIAAHTPVPARIKDRLPDRCFAYVAPGGEHDKPGFTKPRSLRGLLLTDADGKWDWGHIRDAAARFDQQKFHSASAKRAAWRKIERAAKATGHELDVELNADGELVQKPKSRVGAHSEALRGEAPEWIELLPLGEFVGRDGRGPFKLEDPEAVITATQALDMSAGIPIDFDHSTDFAAPQGHPAPAAGWIKALAVRDGFLCARVEWTPAGAKALAHKAYRYVSPVFEYRKDGSVVQLLRAGLTNNPNLKLPAIAAAEKRMALSVQAKKSKLQALVENIKDAAEEIGLPVDTLLEGISHQLGGDLEDPDHGATGDGAADDGDDAASGDELDAAADEETADGDGDDDASDEDGDDDSGAPAQMESKRKAKRDLKRAGRKANRELEKMRRDLKRAGRKANETLERERRARHSMDPEVVAMAARLRDLEAERAREKAEAAVKAAMQARKLAPSQREWGLKLYLESPARFEEFIATAAVILPESDGSVFSGAPKSDGTRELTRLEREICSQLRLDPVAFSKRLVERQISARN
jgi:phage I-like protein